MRTLLALAPLLLATACAVPPPDAYATLGRGRPEQSVDLGQNTVGEACVQGNGSGSATLIYCGAWQQPSARVRSAGAATEAALPGIATSGSWRGALDANYTCSAPQPARLGDMPAQRMDCTRRIGGWPHVALVALSSGQAWLADGVVSGVPAIQRSIAVLSGRATPTIVSSAAVQALQAQRQGEAAKAAGDGREYDSLMQQGARANLSDNPAAAESAYGAALAVQEKALGRDNPNLADPAMHLALQLSNQGRFAEAATLFARAEALAPRQQGDETLLPQLKHYQGLDALNQGKPEQALALLQQADAGYASILKRPENQRQASTSPRGSVAASLEELLQAATQRQALVALVGEIEVKRYQSVLLRQLGRRPESEQAMRGATDLARSAGLEKPELTARLMRTTAVSASLAGDRSAAIAGFRDSDSAFGRAYPGSRPLALIELLRARELVEAGQPNAAVPVCRASIKVLLDIKSAFEPERMDGCLEAFAKSAAAAGGETAQALLRDMFQAAQLVRSSTTSQQIQQASARLAQGGANSKVGEAIREQQDAVAALADIRRRKEALAVAQREGTPVDPGATKQLDDQERTALTAVASRESDLQAAAPNYDQLIQQATSAADLFRVLQPGEAFASITLTGTGGWTFLLRDGTVQVQPVMGGSGAVDPLVQRIRAGIETDKGVFDTKAAESLHALLFGDRLLQSVQALTVAPMGSLLSVPFGLLLTGPADPAALGAAPWLVRTMAIGHVPSAGNFVALRRISGGSQARRAWFGFGDFRPVTLAQARRSFPATCGDSAELLARLPPLPSAKQELEVARRLLGGSTDDELLGARFTAAGVEHENLANYRVLHFATHAILPSELKCQDEPALVTSAPPNAPNASGALLKASDLAQIKLDADVVILSACNSGGPVGKLGGGESLSTLARSFFYGGARALLITHWEVSDQAATFVIADTLRRVQANASLGMAGALHEAQVGVLDRAGKSLPAEFAHPFYWAPFALIGQANAPGKGRQAASL